MKLHWGNAIFIFFTIFIGLSIFFIIFSLRQDIELVEDDYYNKGANYATHMKTQQRSLIFNDSINVTFNKQSILMQLAPSIYKNTDSVKVHFYNPSSKTKDYKILLTNLSDSNTIDINAIKSGRYIIKIKWNVQQNDFFIEKDILLP